MRSTDSSIATFPDPDWARIVVYPATEDGVDRALDRACDADLLVKSERGGRRVRPAARSAHSGIPAQTGRRSPRSGMSTRRLRLDRIAKNSEDPFRRA